MSVPTCPTDATPLVLTFETPGAEYHCLRCGRWLPFFGCTRGPEQHDGQLDALVAAFREGQRGPLDELPTAAPKVEHPDNLKCDGCGKDSGRSVTDGKPAAWWQRTTSDGTRRLACGRECIDRISRTDGEAATVLPW